VVACHAFGIPKPEVHDDLNAAVQIGASGQGRYLALIYRFRSDILTRTASVCPLIYIVSVDTRSANSSHVATIGPMFQDSNRTGPLCRGQPLQLL